MSPYNWCDFCERNHEPGLCIATGLNFDAMVKERKSPPTIDDPEEIWLQEKAAKIATKWLPRKQTGRGDR